jgi:hypothetical protein
VNVGRYVLDALRFQAALNKEEVSDSMFVSSKSSPDKQLCFSSTGSDSCNSEPTLLMFGATEKQQHKGRAAKDG